MEIPKLIILLFCTYCCTASEHSQQSHIIPISGYDSELQDLGQHVEIPETPVKVIKITKTIAVKVPVPYPVKVHEKVPYPVPVAKPYPVPVPQIIKVPHIVTPNGHGQGHDHNDAYKVQEGAQDPYSGGHSFGSAPESQSYDGGHSGHNFEQHFSHDGSQSSSLDAPAGNYYGNTGHPTNHFGGESDESKSYDQAIKSYFDKYQPAGNAVGSNDYHHYH